MNLLEKEVFIPTKFFVFKPEFGRSQLRCVPLQSVPVTGVCCLCIRKEFVEAYLRYIFSDSASEQYTAFSTGFLKVCGGEILSLFQPCELMAMVVGNSNYNWEVMEKVRTWDGYPLSLTAL